MYHWDFGVLWTYRTLLIAGLAPLCGFSPTLVATRILPGVAVSILAGNVFYAWQARRLANRTGRRDVTAIPFGVNTPTIFAYIALIMLSPLILLIDKILPAERFAWTRPAIQGAPR